jgi:GlpG protein
MPPIDPEREPIAAHPAPVAAPMSAGPEGVPGPLRQANSPVNVLLIVGSVLVTLYTSFGADTEKMLPFLISLSPAASPEMLAEVFHGQVWRLFTPMFLHYSVEHLGFNMLGMVNLGGPLEKVSGSRPYLFLCLALALLSNLGEYLINGEPSFGGMSGVLYGLFGYIWLRGRCDPTFVLQMPTSTIVIALVWFVACFTGVLGHIANAAHGIGLVAGAVWGVIAGRAARQRWLRGELPLGGPPFR